METLVSILILSLRAGYGETGNQQIEKIRYTALWDNKFQV
jgi:hypothetical protein